MSDASGPVGRRIDAEELLAHAAWLRALARSLVRDEHAAEDVVQETFAAAVARPPREPGALRGWLARVARNAAWKSMRGDRRRALREETAPRRAPELASDELVARIELQRALLDAVQELEPPYRTVVMMRFYDGKSPRDIARELGVTPEVVWQRLSRATSMLRARLDRDNGGREKWAGVLLLWLDGRVLAKTAAGSGAAAAAAGTGVAIVGTKTVLAAAAAAALGAWLLWPRAAEPQSTVAGAADATSSASLVPPATAPRARSAAETATETASDAASPTTRATTRGRVIDATTGDPIAGARVRVIRKSAGGGFQWSLVTGADGTFSGEATETARYSDELEWSAVHSDVFVEASARGYIRFYEGPWTGPRGEDLGDVKLYLGVVVRGRVVYDDGRPAPGASVYATAGSAQVGRDLALNRARPLGKADEQGRFELDEALPPTTDGKVFTLFAACRDGAAFTTLAVRPGRDVIDDVMLTLHVRGVSVRVLDPDGRPVADATVTAFPQFGGLNGGRWNQHEAYSLAGDETLRGVFVRKTGTDGVAKFDGLPVEGDASLYDVAAAAPGFITGWADGPAVGNPRDASVEIRLAREQSFVVGARVVDPDGRPVEGATVTIAYDRSGKSFVTGADGKFVLTRGKGDPLGLHGSVTITKEGFAPSNSSVYRWPDDGRATTDIKLERRTPITGTVVDQNSKPVAGATVWLQRPESHVKSAGDGKTGADGRFEVTDATPGRWALAVSPPFTGGCWVVSPWTAVEGGQRDVVVRLERLPEGRATVVCSVVDAETGKEIAADAAMLLDISQAPLRSIMGALPQPKIEHGRVIVEKVAASSYALWLRVADRPHQLVRIRVAEGETEVRTACRVRRGVTISGRVRLPEGVTAAGVGLVECSLADGLLSAGGPGWGELTAAGSAKVAADGTFRFEGRTPAVYRLSANAATWMGDTVVDASQGDAAADIELQRAASVNVTVPPSTGYECVRVDVSREDGTWDRLVTAGRSHMPQGVSVTKTLRPGRLRWRATFRATLNSFDPLDTAEPQEGEVVLEAGKTTEIAVPVVPLR